MGEGLLAIHVDTLIMSSVARLPSLAFVFWRAARQATPGVPGNFLAFIELVYEFVDNLVGEMYHGDKRFLVALSLTLFTWILAMNAMDLLPVDLPANIAGARRPRARLLAHPAHRRSQRHARAWPSWCWC